VFFWGEKGGLIQELISSRNRIQLIRCILEWGESEIEAAIQIGVDDNIRTYGDAIGQGVRLRPLVISSGGTLHKKFYVYLKAMIPDQQARRGLCTDVSIALVRARAELFMVRTQ
jgi:hypothetical protein